MRKSVLILLVSLAILGGVLYFLGSQSPGTYPLCKIWYRDKSACADKFQTNPFCKIWYSSKSPCADEFRRKYPGGPVEVQRSTRSCAGPVDADESYYKPYCAEYFF